MAKYRTSDLRRAYMKQTQLPDIAKEYMEVQRNRTATAEEHLHKAIKYFNGITSGDITRNEINLVIATRNSASRSTAEMYGDGTLILYPRAESNFEISRAVSHETAHYFSIVFKDGRPQEREGKVPVGKPFGQHVIEHGIEEAGGYLSGYTYVAKEVDNPMGKTRLAKMVLAQIKSWAGVDQGNLQGSDIIGYASPFLFLKSMNPAYFMYEMSSRLFGIQDVWTNKEAHKEAERTFMALLGIDIALATLAEKKFDVENTIRYLLRNSYDTIYFDLIEKTHSEFLGLILESLRK